MLGAWIRRTGFWCLDALKGSPVKKRKRHLERVWKSGRGDAEALCNLLSHARQTVPFYHDIKTCKLEDFPVVTKQDYRRQFDSFRSSSFLDESALHKVYTSGSSGTPFMAYQDPGKIKWHQAGLININEKIGWRVGDRFAFLRLWGVAHGESRFSSWLSNTVPINVVDFDERKQNEFCEKLSNDNQLSLILGYASAIGKLSDTILQKEISSDKLGVRLIIADSENLSNSTKHLIEQAFGCTVLNRYANNENGILALTEAKTDSFYVNYPEYYLEILKFDADEPVKIGEPGRIVITDLYNYAFPFIRYDTGDIGVPEILMNDQCLVISQLMGRVSASLTDIYGTFIPETVASSFYEDLVGLGRFQIEQTSSNEYIFRTEGISEEIKGIVLERAHKCFGGDARISLVVVDQILPGRNGKYPITINSTLK